MISIVRQQKLIFTNQCHHDVTTLSTKDMNSYHTTKHDEKSIKAMHHTLSDAMDGMLWCSRNLKLINYFSRMSTVMGGRGGLVQRRQKPSLRPRRPVCGRTAWAPATSSWTSRSAGVRRRCPLVGASSSRTAALGRAGSGLPSLVGCGFPSEGLPSALTKLERLGAWSRLTLRTDLWRIIQIVLWGNFINR